MRRFALLPALLWLALGWPSPAGIAQAAAAEPDAPAARASGEFGPLSVVLIASNGRLLAFVDRVADNAPAVDATLTLRPDAEAALPLARLGPGLFAADWPARAAPTRMRLRVAAGPETATEAELALPGQPEAEPAAPPPAPGGLGWKLPALAAAGLALLLAWRGRRRPARLR